MKKIVLILLLLCILIPGGWIFFHKYEGTAPEVTVHLPSKYLNQSYQLDLKVSDPGAGLRQVMVSLMQEGNEKVLLDKTYPPVSLKAAVMGETVADDRFNIPVEARKYGMKDGEAVLRIMVSDASWRGWNSGNRFYEEHTVIIDTTPPKVRILTGQHNIERGGSALIIYQVFEPDVKTGVMVGDNFFPGHSGMFDDPQIKAAFFALDHTQGPGTRMAVTAQDLAGNVTERGFHHYIRDKNFRSDTLNISQGFLEQKMPDFHLGGEMESKFESQADPLVEKFIYVNDQLRRQNSARVLSATSDTVGQLLWQGRFSRLPGAAKRAGFADHRVYKHGGKEISQATHLGVDLASTSHAPVGAANTGRVILAHDEGIYGKVVIIDHGFGLASLYSHLSEIHVNVGDEVKKGDVLGKTGITGMAGGDHLHFSMIVHNVFVNPLEWWDPNWIKNNVTSKIEFVKKDNT